MIDLMTATINYLDNVSRTLLEIIDGLDSVPMEELSRRQLTGRTRQILSSVKTVRHRENRSETDMQPLELRNARQPTWSGGLSKNLRDALRDLVNDTPYVFPKSKHLRGESFNPA